jgi:2-haloacid dehalogenase
MAARPQVIAFDIIETVFSLESMRPRLVSLGLPERALEAWFAAGLRDAFALAVTDRFTPFRSVLEASLQTLLAKHALSAKTDQISSVLDGMKSLQPHADAAEAFDQLKQAGFRLLALSNGAASSTQALLKGAGLEVHVEQILSVEDVGLSKPRREVYAHAAKAAGVAPSQMALVATHPWDLHGAKAAGLITAFVARGQPYPGFMLPPDVQGSELIDVAREVTRLAAL